MAGNGKVEFPAYIQDVFTLPEGEVRFYCPGHMSSESFDELEAWMALQMGRLKRLRITDEGQEAPVT